MVNLVSKAFPSSFTGGSGAVSSSTSGLYSLGRTIDVKTLSPSEQLQAQQAIRAAGGYSGGFSSAQSEAASAQSFFGGSYFGPFQGNIRDPATGNVYSIYGDKGKKLLAEYDASQQANVSFVNKPPVAPTKEEDLVARQRDLDTRAAALGQEAQKIQSQLAQLESQKPKIGVTEFNQKAGALQNKIENYNEMARKYNAIARGLGEQQTQYYSAPSKTKIKEGAMTFGVGVSEPKVNYGTFETQGQRAGTIIMPEQVVGYTPVSKGGIDMPRIISPFEGGTPEGIEMARQFQLGVMQSTLQGGLMLTGAPAAAAGGRALIGWGLESAAQLGAFELVSQTTPEALEALIPGKPKETYQIGGMGLGFAAMLATGKAIGVGISKFPTKTPPKVSGSLTLDETGTGLTGTLKGTAKYEYEGLKTWLTGKERIVPFKKTLKGKELYEVMRPMSDISGYSDDISAFSLKTSSVKQGEKNIQKLSTGAYRGEGKKILSLKDLESAGNVKKLLMEKGYEIQVGKEKFFQSGYPIETSINLTEVSSKGGSKQALAFVSKSSGQKISRFGEGELFTSQIGQKLVGQETELGFFATGELKGFVTGKKGVINITGIDVSLSKVESKIPQGFGFSPVKGQSSPKVTLWQEGFLPGKIGKLEWKYGFEKEWTYPGMKIKGTPGSTVINYGDDYAKVFGKSRPLKFEVMPEEKLPAWIENYNYVPSIEKVSKKYPVNEYGQSTWWSPKRKATFWAKQTGAKPANFELPKKGSLNDMFRTLPPEEPIPAWMENFTYSPIKPKAKPKVLSPETKAKFWAKQEPAPMQQVYTPKKQTLTEALKPTLEEIIEGNRENLVVIQPKIIKKSSTEIKLLSGLDVGNVSSPLVIKAVETTKSKIPGSYSALAGGLGRVKITPVEKVYLGEMKARYGSINQPTTTYIPQTGIKEIDELRFETSKAEQPFKSFGKSQPLKGFEEFSIVPEQKFGNFLGGGTGSKLLVLTGTDSSQMEKSNNRLENIFGTSNISSSSTKEGTLNVSAMKQGELTKTSELTKQLQGSNFIQISNIGLGIRTRQPTKQVTKQIMPTIPLIPLAKIPIVKVPPIILLPPVYAPKPSKAFGYQVLVRTKGAKKGKKFSSGTFAPVSTGVMSKEQALSLGQAITAGTAKRSFKIIPTFGMPVETKRLPAFRPEMYYRKGRTFIEKARFAINTPGEMAEITLKGRKAKKGKRLSGLKPFKIFSKKLRGGVKL